MVHRSMNRARSGFASSFTFALRLFHSVEMRAQSIEARAARIDLRLHPLARLVERVDFQPIDARLSFLSIRDQATFAQHLQMPRHRRIGDVEAREDVARGSLTLGQKSDDVATRRICKCTKGIHGYYLAYCL